MSDDQMQEVAPEANANQEQDLATMVEQLKSQNERLLGESQKYKTRHSELEEYKSKLESIEAQKLEEKGSWQERLELEKSARQKAEEKALELERKVIEKDVKSKIMTKAGDAIRVEDLFTTNEYREIIAYDPESLDSDDQTIDQFLLTVRESRPHWFKKNNLPSMGDAKPTHHKPTQKPLSEMSREELALMRKAKLKDN